MLDEHNDTFLISDTKYLDNYLFRMAVSASRVLVSLGGSSGCAPYECESAMKPIIALDLGKFINLF